MSDGLLQKEKQRNLLLHQEGEIQRQRTFQGHHAPALQVMESREMNVRKQEMQGSLERFYRRFHKDWYSKTLHAPRLLQRL